MKDYQLIAFDMDGTLLNSEKAITEKTLTAIHEAVLQGKYIALNTGRCPAELKEYRKILPDVHYYNCISGALVWDVQKDVIISKSVHTPEMIMQMMEIAQKEDCMIHLLAEKSVVQRDKIPMMDHYRMGIYTEMFRKVTDPVEDICRDYAASPFPVAKFNMYHTDTDARQRTYERFLASGLQVQMAYAEAASLEVSPAGIHKGIGLIKLCEYLGIGIDQVIAVGDADNDLKALETAGLAVAMGNANENVMKASDVVVADNDHDGCAEAIYKYLL